MVGCVSYSLTSNWFFSRLNLSLNTIFIHLFGIVIRLVDSTPEHDLEPPKFARTAFAKLLADWHAVKSLIMLGVKGVQK